MARFRKKPVEIEAVRIKATDINDELEVEDWPFEERPMWLVMACGDNRITPHKAPESDYFHAAIKTDEGTMIGGPGDWIIIGVEGEVYPCRHSVFEATYEPVG